MTRRGSIALTRRPTAVRLADSRANVSVAAVATFCRNTPIRASTITGRLSHWLIVSATVCRPRWWLSSCASTPASSSRGSSPSA